MTHKVVSIIDAGMSGVPIEIECHISNGLPAVLIVGSASRAVDEAKERLRGAFTSSGLLMPKKRVTVNLAPGDIPKDTAGLDLPIALAILLSSNQVPALEKDTLVLGEIGLDGRTRPIRGIIGKLMTAVKQGIRTAYIPSDNLAQAILVPGIELYPVSTLKELHSHLHGIATIAKQTYRELPAPKPASGRARPTIDMSDVVDQQLAKRALEIAAAGGHNILMSGPPGTGKSMLAKALIGVLPALSRHELLEATQIHSLAENTYDQIVSNRPFRAPHHTASNISIIGGGQRPKPGEISLSHTGVLFLDELPEFHRDTIEALRQPLEDRVISVSRAAGNIMYPANFILVATANPCPCGYYGSKHTCECSPHQIARYQHKLSGPILDRIDLFVDVQEVEHAKLLRKATTNGTSSEFRERVSQAREKQTKRFKAAKTNSLLSNREIKQLAQLATDAETMLNKAATTLSLSPRAYMRSIKVARTIADLDSSATIEQKHIAEALQYRQRQQQFL